MEREELVQVATAWMAEDPDPVTRAATLLMLEEGDEARLAACFGGRLEFGTAGLRGPIGPGPLGMNRALAAFLKEQEAALSKRYGVPVRFLFIESVPREGGGTGKRRRR